MGKLFKINNEVFDVGVVEILRKASIERKSLGTTLDGVKHYKTLGTYYDYEITINTKKMNVSEYDRLYGIVTAPVDYYMVTIPFAQSEKTFKASVSTNSDKMLQSFSNFRKWGSLKILIEALEPERVSENG